MRLFVALEVDDEVRRAVDATLEDLRGDDDRLRWTRPDGWHVTLAFLGEVAAAVEPVTAAVTRGVRGADVGPVALRLAEPGRFGRRAAWFGIADDPAGSVARLGEAIQAELEQAALPVERREVRPHLTVVRPKGRRQLPAGFVDRLPRPEGSWTVEHAVLLRSYTEPEGARYEELARVEL